jgi:hypothetical protein
MNRARTLVVTLTAATLMSCSSAAEQTILNEFFAASRLRDTTALRNFSTVSFEPNLQGIITNFDITAVTRDQLRGELVSKDVSILAQVKLPSGQTAQKNLVITLQRARDVTGRWIITSIRDAASSPGVPSTPRS